MTLHFTYRGKPLTVRKNRDEQIEVSRRELAASGLRELHELATADVDGDGWVESHEADTLRLFTPGSDAYAAIERFSRREMLRPLSVATLRMHARDGTLAAPPPTATPLAPIDATDLSHLPRSAFEPLAAVLAHRLADGDSYTASNGQEVVYADVTELLEQHSRPELFAALSVMAYREGGREFGLTRHEDGTAFVVRGGEASIALRRDIIGFDLLVHTHPYRGTRGTSPSPGDMHALHFDPDRIAGVISEDGWYSSYELNDDDKVARAEPVRLWAERT